MQEVGLALTSLHKCTTWSMNAKKKSRFTDNNYISWTFLRVEKYSYGVLRIILEPHAWKWDTKSSILWIQQRCQNFKLRWSPQNIASYPDSTLRKKIHKIALNETRSLRIRSECPFRPNMTKLMELSKSHYEVVDLKYWQRSTIQILKALKYENLYKTQTNDPMT